MSSWLNVLLFCLLRVALNMKFNFTLKTDDDCFVHLESIVEVKVDFKLSCNRVFYHMPVAYFLRVLCSAFF